VTSLRGKLLILGAAVAALLMVSAPAVAHHGTAAFDTEKTVTITGTITEFKFANPHVQLAWEVKGDKGEQVIWQGELTAPNKLQRAGWTNQTLKPGDSVTISGYAVKSGAHTMWIRKLIGPGGKELPLFED
jgi:hypothetical protein